MTEPDTTAPSNPSGPWPSASVRELITMCTSPALIGLGIVPVPGQDEPEIDLDMARHFIDLLALLEEKTSGQLDDTEQQAIEQALHELRMAFIQIQQSTREPSAGTASNDAPPSSNATDVDEDTTVDSPDIPESTDADGPVDATVADPDPPGSSGSAPGPAEDA